MAKSTRPTSPRPRPALAISAPMAGGYRIEIGEGTGVRERDLARAGRSIEPSWARMSVPKRPRAAHRRPRPAGPRHGRPGPASISTPLVTKRSQTVDFPLPMPPATPTASTGPPGAVAARVGRDNRRLSIRTAAAYRVHPERPENLLSCPTGHGEERPHRASTRLTGGGAGNDVTRLRGRRGGSSPTAGRSAVGVAPRRHIWLALAAIS